MTTKQDKKDRQTNRKLRSYVDARNLRKHISMIFFCNRGDTRI